MMNLTGLYNLRVLERDNPMDIERINLMYYHPEVMKAKGYFKQEVKLLNKADLQEKDESMFNILSTISHGATDISFAIVDQLNKLVGWIWFYIEKSHPLPIGIVKRMGLTKNNSLIYQVSYQKLMSDGWPAELLARTIHCDHRDLHTTRKGVIVEGLELSLDRLSHEYKVIYGGKRRLVIYGYVLPENIASQRVLEKNGFIKEKRQYKYDGILNDLWVKII
jgi:RimJ/RimL family protein N-acetyltransferase